MLTIMCSIVNIKLGVGGGAIWSLGKHKNLYFENEQYIHMSPKICEVNGYNYDLEELIIL